MFQVWWKGCPSQLFSILSMLQYVLHDIGYCHVVLIINANSVENMCISFYRHQEQPCEVACSWTVNKARYENGEPDEDQRIKPSPISIFPHVSVGH